MDEMWWSFSSELSKLDETAAIANQSTTAFIDRNWSQVTLAPYHAVHVHVNGTAPGYAFLSSLVFSTLFGNLLVILAVLRWRGMQTLSNQVVASLAVTDFAVAILVEPFAIYVLINRGLWELGSATCLLWITMDVFLCTASITHLCAISINRYIAITRPHQFRNTRPSALQVAAIVGPAWGIAFGIALVLFVQGVLNPHFVLQHVDNVGPICAIFDRVYAAYSSVISFFLPLGIMIFVEIECILVLRRNAKLLSKKKPKGIESLLLTNMFVNQVRTRTSAPFIFTNESAKNIGEDPGNEVTTRAAASIGETAVDLAVTKATLHCPQRQTTLVRRLSRAGTLTVLPACERKPEPSAIPEESSSETRSQNQSQSQSQSRSQSSQREYRSSTTASPAADSGVNVGDSSACSTGTTAALRCSGENVVTNQHLQTQLLNAQTHTSSKDCSGSSGFCEASQKTQQDIANSAGCRPNRLSLNLEQRHSTNLDFECAPLATPELSSTCSNLEELTKELVTSSMITQGSLGHLATIPEHHGDTRCAKDKIVGLNIDADSPPNYLPPPPPTISITDLSQEQNTQDDGPDAGKCKKPPGGLAFSYTLIRRRPSRSQRSSIPFIESTTASRNSTSEFSDLVLMNLDAHDYDEITIRPDDTQTPKHKCKRVPTVCVTEHHKDSLEEEECDSTICVIENAHWDDNVSMCSAAISGGCCSKAECALRSRTNIEGRSIPSQPNYLNIPQLSVDSDPQADSSTGGNTSSSLQLSPKRQSSVQFADEDEEAPGSSGALQEDDERSSEEQSLLRENKTPDKLQRNSVRPILKRQTSQSEADTIDELSTDVFRMGHRGVVSRGSSKKFKRNKWIKHARVIFTRVSDSEEDSNSAGSTGETRDSSSHAFSRGTETVARKALKRWASFSGTKVALQKAKLTIGSRFRQKENTKEKRAERTLILVFICFVVMWLPFFTTNFIYGVCESCEIPDPVFSAFTWLGWASSGVNPCIYTMFNKDFRTSFKRFLRLG